jgi:hypothetical protein
MTTVKGVDVARITSGLGERIAAHALRTANSANDRIRLKGPIVLP